jgi:hypothetical protein
VTSATVTVTVTVRTVRSSGRKASATLTTVTRLGQGAWDFTGESHLPPGQALWDTLRQPEPASSSSTCQARGLTRARARLATGTLCRSSFCEPPGAWGPAVCRFGLF